VGDVVDVSPLSFRECFDTVGWAIACKNMFQLSTKILPTRTNFRDEAQIKSRKINGIEKQ